MSHVQTQHIPTCGSAGNTHTDFSCSPSHDVGHHTVNADGGEHDCQQTEAAEHCRRHAHWKQRHVHVLSQCLNVVEWQRRVEVLHFATQCGEYAMRITGCARYECCVCAVIP